MKTQERLETERLVLRHWRADDAEPMAAINRDPEVGRFLNRPVDETAVVNFYNRVVGHWDTRGYGVWAVERAESAAFVGFVGLADVPSFLAGAAGEPELGWRLARSAWGVGLATEAAAAARDWAVVQLGMPTLISIIHPDNVRSQRVAFKIGMRPVRAIDNPVIGRMVDVWELTDRGR